MNTSLLLGREVSSLRVKELDCLTLEDGTDRFSRNVGKQLLVYAE
jgi:hypothetical protein